MQILTNQPVLNAHSRKNQVSFEKLHINSNITDITDCSYPVLLNDLKKVSELATKDEVILENGYGKHLKVSVIKEFGPELKLPVIESSKKSFAEIYTQGLANFVESLQTNLSTRMNKAREVFNGTDLQKKDSTLKELLENSEKAFDLLEILPEMDKGFKEAVASELPKVQKEIRVKKVKENFFNEVLTDPEI